jgi:hypothetical protein
MQPKSCHRCLGWTESVEAVDAALKKQWHPREACAHEPLMWAAIEQLRTGRPAWWVVNGSVIVPIWAVELVKKRVRGRVVGGPIELVT